MLSVVNRVKAGARLMTVAKTIMAAITSGIHGNLRPRRNMAAQGRFRRNVDPRAVRAMIPIMEALADMSPSSTFRHNKGTRSKGEQITCTLTSNQQLHTLCGPKLLRTYIQLVAHADPAIPLRELREIWEEKVELVDLSLRLRDGKWANRRQTENIIGQTLLRGYSVINTGLARQITGVGRMEVSTEHPFTIKFVRRGAKWSMECHFDRVYLRTAQHLTFHREGSLDLATKIIQEMARYKQGSYSTGTLTQPGFVHIG